MEVIDHLKKNKICSAIIIVLIVIIILQYVMFWYRCKEYINGSWTNKTQSFVIDSGKAVLLIQDEGDTMPVISEILDISLGIGYPSLCMRYCTFSIKSNGSYFPEKASITVSPFLNLMEVYKGDQTYGIYTKN